MIKLEIDGKQVEVEQGSMIINAADALDIPIPRFCYHKKLSIAANCRMCLIDVEKAPKPLPACSTPVTEGMKVWTKSAKAKTAQRSVMEFLLINHPLDCPVCDQGGECELQDVATAYGKDVSRFTEQKRVVVDKDLGPLIATDMTRCIHCTRCVRYGEEVAGIRELGATGRGESMQIGTFVEQNVSSEISGNVIDLCPVGALTAKPYRYTARCWELRQHPGIALHDCLGTNIYYHVKDNQVKRIVPRENEKINEIWIADRDRFSYTAFTHRITNPMIKVNNEWQVVSWDKALNFAMQGLKSIPRDKLGMLLANNLTTEEYFILQRFISRIGSYNIDHRLCQQDFRDQDMAPLFPNLGVNIAEVQQQQSILVIGTSIHKELPLLGIHIRKAVQRGAVVNAINPVEFSYNFALSQQISTNDFLAELGGIAKAIMQRINKSTLTGAENLIEAYAVTEQHKEIANSILTVENRWIIFGGLVVMHPDYSRIVAILNLIGKLTNAKIGDISSGANSAGAWLTGCIPHRAIDGEATSHLGLNTKQMLTSPLDSYLLVNVEPGLDSIYGKQALETISQAKHVVAISAFESKELQQISDVILPTLIPAENSGTVINCQGDWQSFSAAIKPQAESKPIWKIIKASADILDLTDFDYYKLEQITEEIYNQVSQQHSLEFWQWWSPNDYQIMDETIRIVYTPGLYTVDSQVRNAEPLQKTEEASSNIVSLNQKLADELDISDGDTIKIIGEFGIRKLPVTISNKVANSFLFISNNMLDIGLPYSPVDVSKDA